MLTPLIVWGANPLELGITNICLKTPFAQSLPYLASQDDSLEPREAEAIVGISNNSVIIFILFLVLVVATPIPRAAIRFVLVVGWGF